MVIKATQTQILSLLLANPSKEYSIREIATTTSINYRIAYQETMALIEQNIILLNKNAGVNLCKINSAANPTLLAYIENFRCQELQEKYKPIKVLVQEITKIKPVYYTMLLFGSIVTENMKKNSDIDIFFIIPTSTNHSTFEREVRSVLGLLAYPLDINIVSQDEFCAMRREKGLNLASETFSNHIILKGGEQYYELLQK